MVQSKNVKGALIMMTAMAAVTVSDVAMKAMAGQVPLYQIMVLRGLGTIVLVTLLAWRMGALKLRLPRRDWLTMAVRTTADIGAAFFYFQALFEMQLASVTAILQAIPLTVTLGAVLFFGERTGILRVAAIFVGFIGVVLIVRPGTEGFNFFSIYVLIAVLCVTVRDLVTRRLSSETPSLMVTMATAVFTTIAFSLISFSVEWVPIGVREASLLGLAALSIFCGYFCSIVVMRTADVSFVAPFRYTNLIWALILGWLVFGELPDAITMLGALIVVGSGLFMLYREARQARMMQAAKTHPELPPYQQRG
ncbi:MAG: DMT family transporter [Pseudomonadota bacterium]